MSDTATVTQLPDCDFCGEEAHYDFKTVFGPWANGCDADYIRHRLYSILGTGKGQRLEVQSCGKENLDITEGEA